MSIEQVESDTLCRNLLTGEQVSLYLRKGGIYAEQAKRNDGRFTVACVPYMIVTAS
jgi:hypothetical protein